MSVRLYSDGKMQLEMSLISMWLTQRIVQHTLIWKVIASNLRESEIFNLEICSYAKV